MDEIIVDENNFMKYIPSNETVDEYELFACLYDGSIKNTEIFSDKITKQSVYIMFPLSEVNNNSQINLNKQEKIYNKNFWLQIEYKSIPRKYIKYNLISQMYDIDDNSIYDYLQSSNRYIYTENKYQFDVSSNDYNIKFPEIYTQMGANYGQYNKSNNNINIIMKKG